MELSEAEENISSKIGDNQRFGFDFGKDCKSLLERGSDLNDWVRWRRSDEISSVSFEFSLNIKLLNIASGIYEEIMFGF